MTVHVEVPQVPGPMPSDHETPMNFARDACNLDFPGAVESGVSGNPMNLPFPTTSSRYMGTSNSSTKRIEGNMKAYQNFQKIRDVSSPIGNAQHMFDNHQTAELVEMLNKSSERATPSNGRQSSSQHLVPAGKNCISHYMTPLISVKVPASH